MAELGVDLEALRDGVEQFLASRVTHAGFDIKAYISGAPMLPVVGIFPADEYVAYWGSFGPENIADVMLDLRTVAAYGAEDSARLLDRMLSSGAGHSVSLIDPFRDDPTCGGLVQTALPQTAFRRDYGDPNAGLYEAVVRLSIKVKRRSS